MTKEKKMKTIGFSVPVKLDADLILRSQAMGVSKSKYAKTILQRFVDSGQKLNIAE